MGLMWFEDWCGWTTKRHSLDSVIIREVFSDCSEFLKANLRYVWMFWFKNNCHFISMNLVNICSKTHLWRAPVPSFLYAQWAFSVKKGDVSCTAWVDKGGQLRIRQSRCCLKVGSHLSRCRGAPKPAAFGSQGPRTIWIIYINWNAMLLWQASLGNF